MSQAPRRDDATRAGAVAALVLAALVAAWVGGGSVAPDEPPEEASTLFGSNLWQAPGETRREAAARVDATYGPVRIVRVFSRSLPPSWHDLGRDIGPRPVVVSFRLPPEQILSGAADDQLTAWFRAAPTGRDTFWVYFHEPEDEVEDAAFSSQEFSAAWSHVAELADGVDNPRLHATLVLMCWTAGRHSGRDWRDFVPDTGAVDVLAWDCYAGGTDATGYADPVALLEPARLASASVGAAWAIGELGARLGAPADGVDRAEWLEEVGEYAIRHGARFVAYFDAPVGGEFQLTDPPSIRAWARLVRAPARRRRHVAARPRVLLIVGSGRSGSTLLEGALAGATGVTALGEVVHMWDRGVRDGELCGCGAAFGACPFWSAVGGRAFGGWEQVDVTELIRLRRSVVRTRRLPELLTSSPWSRWRRDRDRLADVLSEVLAAAQAESGARLLVDSSKMPAYAALLMRAQVDLRCVQVVRDPRGVANSMRKAVLRPEVTDGADLMHRTGVAEAAMWWSAFDLVTSLLRAWSRIPFTTVRYEDFVADPGRVVKEVLDFSGLSAPDAAVTHIDRDRIVLGTNHQVAGNPIRFRTGAVQVRPDDGWRQHLSALDRRTVEILTAGLRRRYHYR